MKLTATLIALTIFTAGAAAAESRIKTLCGADHSNEAASADDVVANPDGYYIRSLQTQISHGDPRIVQATGRTFNFCTTTAATPDMDSSRAMLLMNDRRVKYLFVPTPCPTGRVQS